MKKPLVTHNSDLIFYDNCFYQVPTAADIRNELGALPDILEKRLTISTEHGVKFISGDGAFVCSRCSHNDIYEQARLKDLDDGPVARIESEDGVLEMGSPLVTNDSSRFCRYEPLEKGPHWLSYYSRDGENGKQIGFAARVDPCAVDYGLIRALVEGGKIDQYKIDGVNIDPTIFPYRREITHNNEAEKKAVRLYQEFLVPKRISLIKILNKISPF